MLPLNKDSLSHKKYREKWTKYVTWIRGLSAVASIKIYYQWKNKLSWPRKRHMPEQVSHTKNLQEKNIDIKIKKYFKTHDK